MATRKLWPLRPANSECNGGRYFSELFGTHGWIIGPDELSKVVRLPRQPKQKVHLDGPHLYIDRLSDELRNPSPSLSRWNIVL